MKTDCGVVYFLLIWLSIQFCAHVCGRFAVPVLRTDGNRATKSKRTHKNRRKNRPESYLGGESEGRKCVRARIWLMTINLQASNGPQSASELGSFCVEMLADGIRIVDEALVNSIHRRLWPPGMSQILLR